MVKALHSLLSRFRAQLYELAGAITLVVGLALVAKWAALIGAAVCLLAKSVEADLKKPDQ